jgi:long-chain acyl-CoA synthetase
MGAPKGVCITHANLIASVGAIYTLMGHHLTPDDTYLAYLPLAHILEYMVEMCLFFVGMTTGFGRVKTLTDVSVRNCKGDISAFRPSVMVGVPTVWETIRKGIIGKINASGTVKKNVFNAAMAAKKANVPVLSQIADSVVFSGVRAATGGRLRIAMSGGAALSRETQQFLSTALVLLIQGICFSRLASSCRLPLSFQATA